MKLGKTLAIIFLYLLFFPLQNLMATEEASIDETSLESDDSELYKILPGDTLKITIYDDEELGSGIERLVGENGLITIPYVNVDVRVTGLSIAECRGEIRKRLIEERIYINPNIDIAISKFARRSVQIIGFVEKPGEMPFEDGKPMAIEEAIAKAGGFSRDKRTARNKVRLTRLDKTGHKITVFVAVDDIMKGRAKPVFLKPGDIIEVTESFL